MEAACAQTNPLKRKAVHLEKQTNRVIREIRYGPLCMRVNGDDDDYNDDSIISDSDDGEYRIDNNVSDDDDEEGDDDRHQKLKHRPHKRRKINIKRNIEGGEMSDDNYDDDDNDNYENSAGKELTQKEDPYDSESYVYDEKETDDDDDEDDEETQHYSSQ